MSRPGPGAAPVVNGADLAALVAARICHDLVGPLGAIGNGVELLTMTGAGSGDEPALIAASSADAAARLRFFRLAYGPAAPGQVVARAEVLQLLAAVSRAGRVSFLWTVEGDPPRDELRAVLLALQCLETALPRGGEVQVTKAGASWLLSGDSPQLQADTGLWATLAAPATAPPPSPAQVQFALLPAALAALGRKVVVDHAPERVVMRF